MRDIVQQLPDAPTTSVSSQSEPLTSSTSGIAGVNCDTSSIWLHHDSVANFIAGLEMIEETMLLFPLGDPIRRKLEEARLNLLLLAEANPPLIP